MSWRVMTTTVPREYWDLAAQKQRVPNRAQKGCEIRFPDSSTPPTLHKTFVKNTIKRGAFVCAYARSHTLAQPQADRVHMIALLQACRFIIEF